MDWFIGLKPALLFVKFKSQNMASFFIIIIFLFLIYFYNYITFIKLQKKNRNFYTRTVKYLHYILLDSTPTLYTTLPPGTLLHYIVIYLMTLHATLTSTLYTTLLYTTSHYLYLTPETEINK